MPTLAPDAEYVRFVLMSLATPGLESAIVAKQQAFLVARFGLNYDELSSFTKAADTLRQVLAQNQKSEAAIISGKQSLSDSDRSAVAALVSNREAVLVPLVMQLFQSVRPEVANRMRATVARPSK